MANNEYLYERLESGAFQRLCGDLMSRKYPDYHFMPLHQEDGGRDGVVKSGGITNAVMQAKHTGQIKKPIAWLEGTLQHEERNIRRLVREGVQKYFIVTSHPGTSKAGSGTIDQVDAVLAAESKRLGIELTCYWRESVDGMLRAAPAELKWQYAECLAGVDLIRYVLAADKISNQALNIRRIITDVVKLQSHQEQTLRFKQIDLVDQTLDALFIDVQAEDRRPAARTQGGLEPQPKFRNVGGAADYLLRRDFQNTFILGSPGQGKSTLTQHIAQKHREALCIDELSPNDHGVSIAEGVRFPIRLELRDYATWVSGGWPYAADPAVQKKAQWRADSSIEAFILHFLKAKVTSAPIKRGLLHEIFEHLPTTVILDGLDEIADSGARATAVIEIEAFLARHTSSSYAPQVIVTARPSIGAAPEPHHPALERLHLCPLDARLQRQYLDKWIRARGLNDSERAQVQTVFANRAKEPHVAELITNPMQLTILLHLIGKRGTSVPRDRTALYGSYMEILLDRESEKAEGVADARSDLEEVMPYVGWRYQAAAELRDGNGKMTTVALRTAMFAYLDSHNKSTVGIRELVTALTDRVWVLVGNTTGTFEFDVQSVREYFTALYLNGYAGEDVEDFDQDEVPRALLTRPYWLNVLRFYGGLQQPRALAGFADALIESLAAREHQSPAYLGLWTLLTDGVFKRRPLAVDRVCQQLAAPLGARYVSWGLRSQRITTTSAPDVTVPLTRAIRERILTLLSEPALAEELAQLLVRNTGSFKEHADWWRACMSDSSLNLDLLGMKTLIQVGVIFDQGQAPRVLQPALLRQLSQHFPAELLNSASSIMAMSDAEDILLAAVHNGICSGRVSRAGSYPADLAMAFDPRNFIVDPDNTDWTNPQLRVVNATKRASLWERLIARQPSLALVRDAMQGARGDRGTVAQWSNAAQELGAIFGGSVLAGEIALIGAALPRDRYNLGGSLPQSSETLLGDAPNYGLFTRELRRHAADTNWWQATWNQYQDERSRLIMARAVIGLGSRSVVERLLPELSTFIDRCDSAHVTAIMQSCRRLRTLASSDLTIETSGLSPRMRALLADQMSSDRAGHELDAMTDPEIVSLAHDNGLARVVWDYVAHRPERGIQLAEVGYTLRYGRDDASPRDLSVEQQERVLALPSFFPASWLEVLWHGGQGDSQNEAFATLAEQRRWFKTESHV